MSPTTNLSHPESAREAGGGEPGVGDDAIVRAAADPTTPLHNLVGDDAVMFVEGVAGPRPV